MVSIRDVNAGLTGETYLPNASSVITTSSIGATLVILGFAICIVDLLVSKILEMRHESIHDQKKCRYDRRSRPDD